MPQIATALGTHATDVEACWLELEQQPNGPDLEQLNWETFSAEREQRTEWDVTVIRCADFEDAGIAEKPHLQEMRLAVPEGGTARGNQPRELIDCQVTRSENAGDPIVPGFRQGEAVRRPRRT